MEKNMLRKTKIIATIGPSCDNYKTLKEMVQAGLNVVRLNMSHGTRESHQVVVDLVKELRKDLNISLPIMMDNRGPEIRVKNFKEGSVEIRRGQSFMFTSNDIIGDENRVALSYPEIIKDINVGDKILACNGLISFKVIDKTKDAVLCKAQNSGVLSNHKSLFLPNTKLNIPYLNKEDMKDIEWASKNNIEYMACSFVNKAQDIEDVRKYIAKHNGHMDLIAKIESKQGVKNLDEILEASDGVMVARGDLGVEVPLQNLPKIQKEIIFKTQQKGKFCITATEMLESMIHSPRPTRAETSDVANAVFDGTSGIMLSGETAMGKYPVSAVRIMSEIAKQAEKSCNYEKRFREFKFSAKNFSDVISYNTVSCSFTTNNKAIMVLSDSGRSPRMISRFKPDSPIIAITDNKEVYQKLNMLWGIYPVLSALPQLQLNAIINMCNEVAKNEGFANENDVIIIANASRYNEIDTDFIKLHVVK